MNGFVALLTVCGLTPVFSNDLAGEMDITCFTDYKFYDFCTLVALIAIERPESWPNEVFIPLG